MKLGFIYAGQGTQYVGMGQSFYVMMKTVRTY